MAVTATTTSVSYAANGSTSSFPVPFKFMASSDLLVTRTVAGVTTSYVMGSHYSVTGAGVDAGGSVDFFDFPLSGTTVTVTRKTPATQPVSLAAQGNYSTKVHESAFDRVTLVEQETKSDLAGVTTRVSALETTIAIGGGGGGGGSAPALTLLSSSASVGSSGQVILRSNGGVLEASQNGKAWEPVKNVFDVRAYGAVADGVTDCTSAFLAATVDAAAVGGTVYIPKGASPYLLSGQWTIPNDSATPPKQKPIKILGDGASWSGRGTDPLGGTRLDMRYSGTYGKLLTTGLGMLEIDGVTFLDGSGGNLPWIYTTNTTLNIHGNAFIGSKVGTVADQDCIILGGTVGIEGDGDPTHGFQGYGTVIRQNFFNRCRRAVYGRTYANGVVVADNTVWSSAGSNLTGGACIEFDSIGGQNCVGNVIANNLIEVTNYPYAIKLGAASQNTIAFNNFYDSTVTSLAGVRFEATATFNIVHPGFKDNTMAAVSDAAGTNQYLGVDQGEAVKMGTSGPMVFNASSIRQDSPTGAPFAWYKNLSWLDEVWMEQVGINANLSVSLKGKPSGGSNTELARFQYYGVNQSAVQAPGSAFAGFETPNADMRLRAKTGSVVWIGDIDNGQPFYFIASTNSFVFNVAGGKIKFNGAGGPMITSGTGSPAGVLSAEVGSLYMRTDGGTGTTLYVKETGGSGNTGWVAK